MEVTMLDETNIHRGLKITETTTNRHWWVKEWNEHQAQGWTIKSGETLRCIFPIDFEDYFLS